MSAGAPQESASTTPDARSCGLPDRTKGGGDGPLRRTHQRFLRARQQGRLLEKTRGRWRRRQGATRRRQERCLRKIPRYSPLRKLATARRWALPRDGSAALPATRSAMNRSLSRSPSGGTDVRRSATGVSLHNTRCAILWTPGPHERWRRRSRSGGRTGAPSGSTARQAPGKDAWQVEASAGCNAYTAGKVFAEESAILTVAGACDGTTAGLAARRIRTHRRSA
jgi:hypothetical protein